MNAKEYMILIKNEIKTNEIRFCKYNRTTHKWNVTFNNGKKYDYSFENVKWLKKPKIANPINYQIKRNGIEFLDIDTIYIFYDSCNSYWHILFQDGREQDYKEKDLEINESCLVNEKSKNVFDYLKKLSSLSNLKDEKTGEKILEKIYDDIKFVDYKLALTDYLNPKISTNKKMFDFIPIFPFGCNKSQYTAVENAFKNKISVIQGPPGTGKTQTILNIIANILIQGKTVQVVSNNNSAIENIYEKLSSPQYNLSFLVAYLGKSENKKKFIANQCDEYPNFELWEKGDESITLEKVKNLSLYTMNIFEKKEKLACLEKELQQLMVEKKYFDEYVNESDVEISRLKFNKRMNSKKIMRLWHKCQNISERNEKIGFFFKMRSVIFYGGLTNWKFYKRDISEIITTFQSLFYFYKNNELEQEITNVKKELDIFDEDHLYELSDNSLQFLKEVIMKRYGKRTKRKIFTNEDLWKKSKEFLREFPIVLSTTFSSKNSLNKSVVFDYLIMDEASQVDIATGALALSSAKNAIIVGDIKQLPNVVTTEIKQFSDTIFKEFDINEGYHFSRSFLQSVIDVIPGVPNVLLREHYRCHPKIINFCNQKFYNDELIIMTQNNGEKDVLSMITTNVGNHSRGHYNQREIDVIYNEILPKIDKNSLGIITPYRNQVNALTTQLKEFDIDIDTVHKFQGREKDTIILSTVDDELTDFSDDPYLLNVAISRAKKKLVLVVSGNEQKRERNINDLITYIQYNNFEIRESKIYSIFDYLYNQYTEERQKYLKKYSKISVYDSENLMFNLIKDVLVEGSFNSLDVVLHFPLNMLIKDPKLLNDKECRYVMNPTTHIDFLIYSKISKTPALAIEVDGYDFHKEGTIQFQRDEMKNRILELYDIPYLRFKTNGSGEKELLLKALSKYVS